MTPKERMLTALRREKPDRLPVTIHQWQPYHLNTYMNGVSDIEANAACGLDASITYFETLPVSSPDWRVTSDRKQGDDGAVVIDTVIETPEGRLTCQHGQNEMTTWVTQHLIKQPEDIRLLGKYQPVPRLNSDGARDTAARLGDGGILRTFICGAQGGCWQDACELFGAENLILATFDDPDWVHEFMSVLLAHKLKYIEQNLPGLPFDLIETGGGAASNTLISPAIHEEFCLPYDRQMHEAIRAAGFPSVYHTCGGMSKITYLIRQNGCAASETLSPAGVGGDIGDDETARQVHADLSPYVALIGGMDQFNVLEQGTADQIEREVFRLFELFGQNGGYILSASDHFFNAPPDNLKAFAQAAKACTY